MNRRQLSFAKCIALASLAWPASALGDHVPDNLAQELDPNYVRCMMAVDDASTEFRDQLQRTCLSRMVDICSGRDGVSPPSQVIDCLHFETQRALDFLSSAVTKLPGEVNGDGLFSNRYQTRLEDLLNAIQKLEDQDKPQGVGASIQRVIAMASAVRTAFWFARETATPLEEHVRSTSGDH